MSIHENAFIGRGAHIGPGAFIGRGAHIGPGAFIGPDAFIGLGAHIGQNAYIGARSHIGLGAHIGQRTVIGLGAHIGQNAYIGPDATIGASAYIGGGFTVERTEDHIVLGPALSSDRMTTALRTPNGVVVFCGCFTGSLAEFRDAIKETHAENEAAREQYLRFAGAIELILA